MDEHNLYDSPLPSLPLLILHLDTPSYQLISSLVRIADSGILEYSAATGSSITRLSFL